MIKKSFLRLSVVWGMMFLVAGNSFGQDRDTLRVMAYNLLNYGEVTSYCTTTNNPIASKDEYFKTIAKHVDPDILVVNEMGASAVYSERILAKVLNTDGVSKYQKTGLQSNGFSNIVNAVFFNKNKFKLVEQQKVTKNLNNTDIVRAIDICTFYYKDPLLDDVKDTTYIHVVAAHLKAGNSSSDQTDRALASEAVMAYLEANYETGNFILAGDLNLKGSSENGYKNLTSQAPSDYRFYDPIDSEGNWNNSSAYKNIHTQSTRSSSTNGGCFSGGGMDDRFDVILMSESMLADTGQAIYVDGSYDAVGQDGNHFNQAINSGSNSSVPSSVLSALYEMSDHLPVIADIAIEKLEQEPDTTPEGLIEIMLESKVYMSNGQLIIKGASQARAHFEIFNMVGGKVSEGPITRTREKISMLEQAPGVYIIRLTSASGASLTQKVILTRD